VTADQLHAIAQLKLPLTSFDLSQSGVDDDALQALAAIPSLRHVNLSGSYSFQGRGLESLTHVESLELGGRGLVQDELWKACRKLLKLRQLRLFFFEETQDVMLNLARLTQIEELELGLGFDVVSSDPQQPATMRWAPLGEMRSLRKLRLDQITLLNEELAPVRMLTELRELTLPAESSLDDDCLASFVDLPALEVVSLNVAQFSPSALRRLRAKVQVRQTQRALSRWQPPQICCAA